MSFADRSFTGDSCNLSCPYLDLNRAQNHVCCKYYREIMYLDKKSGTVRCRQCVKNIEISDKPIVFTKSEMAFLRVAFIFYKKYRDGNPDVGMGPSDISLLADVFSNVGIGVPFDQYESILKQIKGEYKWK